MKSAADTIRRSQIAKIKMAAKQLGLDDDVYRALLQRVTGKASCADMTIAQRDAVLDALKAQGWQPKGGKGGKAWPGRPKDTDNTPMLRKVEALLADAKRPWDYAHATAHQMFGVDRLEFLNNHQLHRLVAALQIDANRRK